MTDKWNTAEYKAEQHLIVTEIVHWLETTHDPIADVLLELDLTGYQINELGIDDRLWGLIGGVQLTGWSHCMVSTDWHRAVCAAIAEFRRKNTERESA